MTAQVIRACRSIARADRAWATAARYCANRGGRGTRVGTPKIAPSKTVSARIGRDRRPRTRAISQHRDFIFCNRAEGRIDAAFSNRLYGACRTCRGRDAAKRRNRSLDKTEKLLTPMRGFSLREQCVHCVRGFFDRNQRVGPMNLMISM